MPAISIPQENTWSDNVYWLTVTRLLIVIGVSYLLRHLYQLIPWLCSRDMAAVARSAAEGGVGLELDDNMSEVAFSVQLDTSTEDPIGVHLPPSTMRPPPASYHPHGRRSRSV